MGSRRFFSTSSPDSRRDFAFQSPVDAFHQFTQSLIGSPTIATLMSGSRSSFTSDARDSCDSCQSRFTLLKRRVRHLLAFRGHPLTRFPQKTCSECDLDYCSACLSPSDPLDVRPGRRMCRRCRVLNARPLDRVLLMTLRVRDLRWYLQRQHVDASHCKEKTELVDLVLQRNGYRVPSYGAASATTSDAYRSQRREEPQSRQSADQSSGASNDEWIFVNREDADAASGAQAAEAGASNRLCDNECKSFKLEDLESEEEITRLSARQLKVILTRNFVDFKGCCERSELMDKCLRLWREKQATEKLSLDEISDENLCKICMERAIDCVLLECGHMISCVTCGKRLSECPVCRQYVVRAVRIFKS